MSNELKNTHDIEKQLETYYQKGDPSKQFVDALESKLLQEHPGRTVKETGTKKPVFFRPAFVPAFIALLAFLIVIVVGPKEVLAQVQALLGYVPGYGFVEIGDVRVLPSPVSQTQDGVTVNIQQVLVKEENTYIILRVDGLPSQNEIYADLNAYMLENLEDWSDKEPEIWRTQTFITLSDGTILDESYFGGAPWAGFFSFPTLPKNVLSLTLDMDRIPGLLPGKSPKNWHFELSLEYLSDPESAPDIQDYALEQMQPNPNLITPIPVEELSAPDPVYGFSLELVDAVYAETETALRVRIADMPAGWILNNGLLDGQLTDDLGNSYSIIYGPSSGQQQDGTNALTFDPVDPAASTLTLSVADVIFSAPMERQTIMVNFGDAAKPGDVFPLDQTVMVLGTPIHFSSVRIVQEEAHTAERTLMNMFQFEIDPIPVRDGMSIGGIGFAHGVAESLGSTVGSGSGGGSGLAEDPEYTTLSLSTGIPATVPLPTGDFEFTLDNATVFMRGPYTITWEIADNQ